MPNLLDLMKGYNLKLGQTVIVRQERIKREGSRPYVWEPGAITTTASARIEIRREFPGARKYEPLDFLEVVNNEATNDLTVKINGEKITWPVPAKTTRTIRNQAIWTLKIVNDGAATTTAGKIIITVRKEAITADSLARRMA